MIAQFLGHSEVGGAALVGMGLAASPHGRSHGCQLWAPAHGVARSKAATEGLECQTFDNRPLFTKSRALGFWGNAKLALSLRQHPLRLVHVHCPFAYAAFRFAFRRSRAVRVVHVHIELPPEALNWTFRQPPELIVTCANFMEAPIREALPAALSGRTRVEAIPNAIDLLRFRPGNRSEARQAVGISSDRPAALMIANLAPHKGHRTAIHAIRLLRDGGENVELWCAGVEREGETLTKELKQLAQELGVGDLVRFLGFRADVPQLLQAANVVLLPSMHEGLPLSILEAQATRIPVIASRTPGIAEVVKDGKTGMLVSADDPPGYARGLHRCLHELAHTNRMVETAYEYVTHNHNWDTYCARMFTLYEDELRRHGAR